MQPMAVLWDLDGVLADTVEAHFRSWVTALAEWQIPLDRPTFQRLFGRNNRETLAAILGRPPEPQESATIPGRKEHLFRLEAERIVAPGDGALALLEEFQAAGWLQAIASSAPQANIDLLVDKFGVRDRFQAICSGADLPAGKPDPALFLQAAGALRVPAGRCVVLEDSLAGIEAARRAGMRCVAVATTRPRADLEAADWVYDTLSQVSVATLAKSLAD